MPDNAVPAERYILFEHILDHFARIDWKIPEMFVLIVCLIKPVPQQRHHSVSERFLRARLFLDIRDERSNDRRQQLLNPILYQELN